MSGMIAVRMSRVGAFVFFVNCLAPAASAQCTRDVDCREPRICVAGQCQDPSAPLASSACSLAGPIPADMVFGLANSEATSLLRGIGSAADLENMPRIVSGPVDNAMAVIYGRERLIVYRPDFMDHLRNQAGTEWAVKFVLAHELGHHAEGHTVSGGGSNHSAEFQADRFAAKVLKRMRARVDEAAAAMRAMPMPASGSHPSSADREQRIRQVYAASGPPEAGPTPEQTTSTPVIPPPPPPVGLPSGAPTRPCGCWGFVQAGSANPNPNCASGFEVPLPCMGMCMGGTAPWYSVCR